MNINRIDPRVMKELLSLQLTQSVNSETNAGGLGTITGDSSSSLFDTLLSQYMSTANQEGLSGTISPAVALAQLGYYQTNVTSAPPASAGNNFGDYSALIDSASLKYGVDANLIGAVISTESGFRSDAVSSAGAKGLMQLMDGTARGLGVTDPFDPQQNVEGGTKYLSLLMGKYNGNVGVALAAYNAGPGRIDRLGIHTDEQLQANMDALPEETQHYVKKVLSAL